MLLPHFLESSGVDRGRIIDIELIKLVGAVRGYDDLIVRDESDVGRCETASVPANLRCPPAGDTCNDQADC